MVLTEKEKNGALIILKLLSDAEIVSLAKTVTKGQIHVGTREGKNGRMSSVKTYELSSSY